MCLTIMYARTRARSFLFLPASSRVDRRKPKSTNSVFYCCVVWIVWDLRMVCLPDNCLTRPYTICNSALYLMNSFHTFLSPIWKFLVASEDQRQFYPFFLLDYFFSWYSAFSDCHFFPDCCEQPWRGLKDPFSRCLPSPVSRHFSKNWFIDYLHLQLELNKSSEIKLKFPDLGF